MKAKKQAAPDVDYFQIEVVERFTSLYGAPSKANENVRAMVLEYREAFERVERSLLREAVSKAIKLHDFSASIWPSIGLIQKQITEVGAWRVSQNAREAALKALKASPWDAPRDPPEVRARVRKMAEETLAKLRADDDRARLAQGIPSWHPADRGSWGARRFDLIWEGRTVNSPTFHQIGARPVEGQPQ